MSRHKQTATPSRGARPALSRTAAHAAILGTLLMTSPTLCVRPHQSLASAIAAADAVHTMSAAASRGAVRAAEPMSTTRVIALTDAGLTRQITTEAHTIADALRADGVVLGPDDTISPATTTVLAPDGTPTPVTITRVTATDTVEVTQAPFTSRTEEDPGALEGTQRLVQQGQPGLTSTIVTVYTTHAGVVVSRVPTLTLKVSDPLENVVAIGTKKPPVVARVAAAPAPAPAAAAAAATKTATYAAASALPGPAVAPGSARAIGQNLAAARGWGADEFVCLDALWTRESGWSTTAGNPGSGAYGIPQALPADKMASAGADWATNPATQIAWGLGYIGDRYGSPCAAWAHSESVNWY